MYKRSRGTRMGILIEPNKLARMNRNRALWFETEEELQSQLEWGRRKEELLAWIKRQMGRRLTLQERRLVTLHYIQGLTLAEMSKETGVSISTSSRILRRSLRRLRQAAREDTSWKCPGVTVRKRGRPRK